MKRRMACIQRGGDGSEGGAAKQQQQQQLRASGEPDCMGVRRGRSLR